ncbi:MAG: hypothetical protein JWM11_5765 [Planctomycetaceae bacterium]|nr:hypothetical protein [Planctomycetaceae bacterium]
MLPQLEPRLTSGCCRNNQRQSPGFRRRWDLVTGGLSASLWIFLPKCPACLAAYLTFWDGARTLFRAGGLSSLVAGVVECGVFMLSRRETVVETRFVEIRTFALMRGH